VDVGRDKAVAVDWLFIWLEVSRGMRIDIPTGIVLCVIGEANGGVVDDGKGKHWALN